jgi:hypothetical protein
LAQQRRDENLPDEALLLVDRTLEVGEPRNILQQVWFLKGEILSEMGDCETAVAAYRQVRQSDPSGTGQIVRNAERRIDEIRFGGRELREIRGRC